MGFGAAHGNEDLPRGAMGAVLYLEKFWISVPWLTSAMVDHLNSCWVSSCLRSPPDSVFKLSCLSVRLSDQILLPKYLMNCLNNFDKTGREYPPAHPDDLIRFWRSKVKVTAGRWGQILWTRYLMNYLSCHELLQQSLYNSTQLYCNIFAAEQLNC